MNMNAILHFGYNHGRNMLLPSEKPCLEREKQQMPRRWSFLGMTLEMETLSVV
jgi:hypothetical protein